MVRLRCAQDLDDNLDDNDSMRMCVENLWGFSSNVADKPEFIKRVTVKAYSVMEKGRWG